MNELLWIIAAVLALAGLREWGQRAADRTGQTAGFIKLPFTPPAGWRRPGTVGGSAVKAVTLDDLYRKHATAAGLDWRLLKAIAIVESSENPNAVNPSDPSAGLMQVLCAGPGPDGRCTNRLNLPGWPPRREALFDPDTNLQFAAGILKWNIDSYGLLRGIAVYNRWASRLDPPDGPFGNQTYVDKVTREYRALGGRI